MLTILKRTLAAVVLLGAAGALGTGGAQAAHMTTVKGTGYTFQYPSTWSPMESVKLTSFFDKPSLLHLAATANLVFTKDNYEILVAFVQHSAPGTAQLKKLERSMLSDGLPLSSTPKYQTLTGNKVTFLTTSALAKDYMGQTFEMVNATQRNGKTYYFLIWSQVTTTAKGKAEGNQVFDILDSITLD
jgi:hypothetical protein